MAYTSGTTPTSRLFSFYVVTAGTTSTNIDTIMSATFSMSAGSTASSGSTWTSGATTDFTAGATQLGYFEFGTVTNNIENSITKTFEETGADVSVEKQVTIEGTIIGAGISAALTANLVALDEWEAKDEILIILHNTAAGVVYIYPRVKLSVGSAVADNLETYPISATKKSGVKTSLRRFYKYPF